MCEGRKPLSHPSRRRYPPSCAGEQLHRSIFGRIDPGACSTWRDAYRKVHAEERADLDNWARERTGASPSPCGSLPPAAAPLLSPAR